MQKEIVHLIVGLSKGGAETMLYQVLRYRQDSSLSHRVISLGAGDYYEKPIRDLGIPVVSLPLNKKPLSSLWQLRQELSGVDRLVCWMYHANFLGYLLGKLCRIPQVIWNIRHSNLDPVMNKKRTLQINAICAKWSWNSQIQNITYNGSVARTVHEDVGYCPKKGRILVNGCDSEVYAPIHNARKALQKELNISHENKIVVSVGTDHPRKDIPNFITAFGELRKYQKNVVAVICGLGITSENIQLAALCQEHDLTIGKDIFLLGLRHDVPLLLSASDLYVLHSRGEAFPNALLQAMFCGCVCLATDAGDARYILNRPEYIVPMENSQQLQEGMKRLLALPVEEAHKMREENRKHVLENFDIYEVVKRYEKVFSE